MAWQLGREAALLGITDPPKLEPKIDREAARERRWAEREAKRAAAAKK
jgi:hypothetical protein